MKKFLSLIVMAIAFAIQLPAQIVTVGNENDYFSFRKIKFGKG